MENKILITEDYLKAILMEAFIEGSMMYAIHGKEKDCMIPINLEKEKTCKDIIDRIVRWQ